MLAKAKDNKAPGEDRISYEFFKHATKKFIEEVANSFNIIFEYLKKVTGISQATIGGYRL